MEIEQPPIKHFNHLIFALVAGVGIFFFYQLFGGGGVAVVMLLQKTEWVWLVQGIGQFLFMLIPAVFVTKYSPLGKSILLRTSGRTTSFQWVAGLCGVICIQIFVTGLAPLQEALIPESLMPIYNNLQFQIESIYRTLLAGTGIVSMIKGLFIGALIPAFSEEILFRGVMQRSLERVFSPFKAICWTGVLFGIIHFNPTEIIPLIGIGIYLGILAFYTQSLRLPIVAHFLNNTIAIVDMNLFAGNSFSVTSEQLSMSLAGLLCSTGLAGIVIASLVVIRKSDGNARAVEVYESL